MTKDDLLKRKTFLEKDNETAYQYYFSWELLDLNRKELSIINKLLEKIDNECLSDTNDPN